MMNKFKLPVFAITVAMAIAFTISAFIGKSSAKENTDPGQLPVSTYFRFMGTPGQEDDETKWSEITQGEYDELSQCSNLNDGCRLITEKTQLVASALRPQLVEVTISGAHKNPKTSALSGVTAVGNKNP
ncbi:MAG: hypothetical protein ABWZ25_00950 [Chitinophagaceae bacterium]